jgi:hypothetical protein
VLVVNFEVTYSDYNNVYLWHDFPPWRQQQSEQSEMVSWTELFMHVLADWTFHVGGFCLNIYVCFSLIPQDAQLVRVS